VIQDIRTTLARRFPRRVVLWPVPVQGEGAAERIAAAIEGFSRLEPGGAVPRPDVLIVARGGGSLEDLMAFNDEAVVRAAAGCTIPLISAVGHETDTTLIDFASDRRAPTPTAAAELAVPSRVEMEADLQQKGARLSGALGRVLQERRLRLQRAERGLPDLPGLLGTARQRLDDRSQRLSLALPGWLAQRRAGLLLAGSTLRAAIRHALAGRAAVAGRVLPRLSAAPIRAGLREARARLAGAAAGLEALSYTRVLERGFALASDAAGQPITSAAAIRPGQRIRLQFADGRVAATADGAKGGTRQGSLPL
jgi:exodeoxyribonuclease VII large subunit